MDFYKPERVVKKFSIENDVETFYLPGENGENVSIYNYFDCKVVDNDYLTEDYYFSYL